jgi:hypothetical protein
MRIMQPIVAAALVVVIGLAASANAETVTGTLRFANGSDQVKPITNAVVEVWRFRPGVTVFGGWGWAMDLTQSTDGAGHLNVALPYVGSGVQYQLRVFATNPATKLFADDVPFLLQPFYGEPGPVGATIIRVTSAASNVHDFTYTFTDSRRQYFNIAAALQVGFNYANARRDPRETDTIGQVATSIQGVTATGFYDPVTKAIRLKPEDAMNDHRILHEYGHYLEERISSFVGIPAEHRGCTSSPSLEDPGYAWMEGFANYFALAVTASLPSDALSGTLATDVFETPSCPGVTAPRIAIERFVTAALFDLMDGSNEVGDGFCSAASIPGDTLVFQIFDRELDIGYQNPSLQHFVNAWIARGLDLPMLRRSLDASGIAVALPAPTPRYDLASATNIAVWRTVGTTSSQWWVAGGQGGVVDWGRSGDVPVPADYDGDSLTDVAIWRPSDGNWWILKSGSNQVETTQWGTAGDIPLPADYDGDNEIDLAVYRPSDQNVYVFSDGCGFHQGIHVGVGVPVVGDFDGDGFDEPGAYLGGGQFTIQLHSGGALAGTAGGPGNPVVRDYDGDGRSDFAVFDTVTAWWSWRESSTGTAAARRFGQPFDVPVPADYGNTGRAQLAVWTRTSGLWRVLVAGGTRRTPDVTNDFVWGVAGDVPVPAS